VVSIAGSSRKPMEFQANPQSAVRGRIPSLDGLRGICILLVLIAHVGASSKYAWKFPAVGLLASTAMAVFFVISGFLITTVLTREKRRTGTLSLRNFYIRRFLRIFPVAHSYIAGVGLLGRNCSPSDYGEIISMPDFHSTLPWRSLPASFPTT
jgi:peptidoglycan/LPS O-acetylase OafA/YrhL